MRKRIGIFWLFSLPLSLTLAGCGPRQDCICTTELRVNYCITVNGSGEIPDSLTIVRTRKGIQDTLRTGSESSGNCFYEAPGKSSLQVFKDGALIREIKGIKVKIVDCCHGEPKAVDIAL